MPRPSPALVVAFTALVVALGGVAWSAIPDQGGVIRGCYDKNNGALRVIDTAAGQSCDASREIALNWNQQGPAGPQGPAGAPGPQGAPGADRPSPAFHLNDLPLSVGKSAKELKAIREAYAPKKKEKAKVGLLPAIDVSKEFDTHAVETCGGWQKCSIKVFGSVIVECKKKSHPIATSPLVYPSSPDQVPPTSVSAGPGADTYGGTPNRYHFEALYPLPAELPTFVVQKVGWGGQGTMSKPVPMPYTGIAQITCLKASG